GRRNGYDVVYSSGEDRAGGTVLRARSRRAPSRRGRTVAYGIRSVLLVPRSASSWRKTSGRKRQTVKLGSVGEARASAMPIECLTEEELINQLLTEAHTTLK